MPDIIRSYRTFISSPRDVSAERQLAEEVVLDINRNSKDTLNAEIDIRKWEHMPPITTEEKIQENINRDVEKSHFFVLILYKRYGHVEEGHTKSNTERELDTILRRYENNKKLKILAYFRNLPENTDPGEQESAVREFRERLNAIGIHHRSYNSPEEFKNMFTHDMYNVLIRMCLSPFKQSALKHFWRFGEPNRPTTPNVAIFHPSASPVENQQTLYPLMYFEHYKAIHKIKKMLSMIGVESYKTFFHTDIPGDHRFMNRIWICFPRSMLAQDSLRAYGDVPRFRFDFKDGRTRNFYWKAQNGDEFLIKSPLQGYLVKQRKLEDLKKHWEGQLGKIICRDYAVLTRFQNIDTTVSDEDNLYEYYIAGIRGLGTWGASWYLDRKSKSLLNYPETGNIQILLEVTYRDGRIADVEDVSDKPPGYFEERSRMTFIRNQIENQRKSI